MGEARELLRGYAPPRDQQIEDLKKRFHGFDVPPGEIDLTETENADKLRIFGIPPRPPKNTEARKAWDMAFGKKLELKRFIFQPGLFKKTKYRIMRRQVDVAAGIPSRFETSRNWAGAYSTSNEGRHFIQIWGFWNVPKNLTVPPPPFDGQPGLPYVAVNWIGLDGQRAYLDSSLPQIGTQASLDAATGKVTATSWLQWWAKDDPKNGPVPTGLDVSPGDRIAAVLTAIDPVTVLGVMVNLTQCKAMSVCGTAPPVTLPSGATVTPEIEGATAEWIMERSAILAQTTQNNLANYVETEFCSCLAIEAEATDIAFLESGTPQGLSGARFIRMFDVLPNPTRTAFTSMPHKVDDSTLKIKYGGF